MSAIAVLLALQAHAVRLDAAAPRVCVCWPEKMFRIGEETAAASSSAL
jgi:hypothetical protein